MNPTIQSVLFSDDENGDERTIFLSYKSTDKAIVERFAQALKRNGLKPWFDEWHILPGDSIPQELSKGLRGSDVLVFFLSPDSVADNSRWVAAETSSAFQQAMSGKVSIIPVLLERCDIPALFEHIKYINYPAKGFDKSAAELINAIEHQRRKLQSSR